MPLVTLSGLLFFLLMTDTILARIWGEIKERDRRKRATRRIEFGSFLRFLHGSFEKEVLIS